MNIKTIEFWLGWDLPTGYRNFNFDEKRDFSILIDDKEIIQLNRSLREEYDGAEDWLWKDEYYAFGGNGCGDYFYLIKDSGDKIYYADPDRLGEWGASREPLYENIDALYTDAKNWRTRDKSL